MASLLSVRNSYIVQSVDPSGGFNKPLCRLEIMQDLKSRSLSGVVHTLPTLKLKRVASTETEDVRLWYRWLDFLENVACGTDEDVFQSLIGTIQNFFSTVNQNKGNPTSCTNNKEFLVYKHQQTYYYHILSLFSLFGTDLEDPQPCKLEVFQRDSGSLLLYYQLQYFDLNPVFPADRDGNPQDDVSSESLWILRDIVLIPPGEYGDPIALLENNINILKTTQCHAVPEGQSKADSCFALERVYLVKDLPSYPVGDLEDEDYMFFMEVVRDVSATPPLRVIPNRCETFSNIRSHSNYQNQPKFGRMMVHDCSFIRYHLETESMPDLISRLKFVFEQEWGIPLPWDGLV